MSKNNNVDNDSSIKYISDASDIQEYDNTLNEESVQMYQNRDISERNQEQQIPPSKIIYNYHMKVTAQSPFQKQLYFHCLTHWITIHYSLQRKFASK